MLYLSGRLHFSSAILYAEEIMNRFFVILKRPLLAILLFLLFQVLASFVVWLIQMFTGAGSPLDNLSSWIFDPRLMGIALFSCNLLLALSCLVLFRRSLYTRTAYVPRTAPWRSSAIAFIGCILGTIGLNLVSELVALPNLLEHQMLMMLREPWGIAAIALGAPLGEEIMFRWGIMGHMLHKGVGIGASVMASALLFGLMHMNPAQVFFAAAMGIFLGILYWRSGSILLPFLFHAFNNSVPCLLVWVYGDKAMEFSLVRGIGGNTTAWSAACLLIALSAGIMWWYAGGKDSDDKAQQTT